ncbi:MAG: iron-containing alcohol dehydrogenase, partial [Eubacteriales bacterium]|nr:iron-containing alcohol dehydrogenase [Eubacteriales bacterium]
MLNFNFYSPTRFIFGRGVENQAGEQVLAQGAKKALVVYGGGSAVKSGLLARVTASLEEKGVAYVTLG